MKDDFVFVFTKTHLIDPQEDIEYFVQKWCDWVKLQIEQNMIESGGVNLKKASVQVSCAEQESKLEESDAEFLFDQALHQLQCNGIDSL